MATGCLLACSAHAPPGSVLERLLSGRISEYGARGGRFFRGLDALVLCRRFGGRLCRLAPPIVIARPDLLAHEDLPSAPHQKRSVDKRSRLKAAGRALFGSKGYERASIEEIVERAGLAVGTFYQHFRSKRQLLLSLMNELLEKLGQLNLRPAADGDARARLHHLLRHAFATDLQYLGVYRAWQEAVLFDPYLARKQIEIHAWTTARVESLFRLLTEQPGARQGVDISSLARIMDSIFWNLLPQAMHMSKLELERSIESSAHLIYHALFTDAPSQG
jgi:AcrR family transcriptional regulator